MCSHAAGYMIENGGLSPKIFSRMDDATLMMEMKNAKGYPDEIASRLDERRLFKRALYTGFDSIDDDVFKTNISRAEIEISETAGISPDHVLVDIPEKPEIPEMKAQVMINGNMIPIDKASVLVSTLEKAQIDNWKLGVFTPSEYREKVGKIAREFFGVKKDTKQFKLTEL